MKLSPRYLDVINSPFFNAQTVEDIVHDELCLPNHWIISHTRTIGRESEPKRSLRPNLILTPGMFERDMHATILFPNRLLSECTYGPVLSPMWARDPDNLACVNSQRPIFLAT